MPSIVFLCVANSARSQIAEGLARAAAPNGWKVYSAGSRPTHISPHAIQTLADIGIDGRSQRSKGLDEVPISEADWVITLCAEEECPVGTTTGRKLHWPVPDPTGAAPDVNGRFAEVRDWIGQRLTQFWSDLPDG